MQDRLEESAKKREEAEAREEHVAAEMLHQREHIQELQRSRDHAFREAEVAMSEIVEIRRENLTLQDELAQAMKDHQCIKVASLSVPKNPLPMLF